MSPISIDEHDSSHFAISVRIQKHWFMCYFLPVWLLLWLVFEVGSAYAMVGVLRAGEYGKAMFLAFWLAVWTAGGVLLMRRWLWMVGGNERITVDSSDLCVSRFLFGIRIGKTTRFDLPQVTQLCVVQLKSDPVLQNSKNGFAPQFGVSFDYKGVPHIIARGIESKEATSIVRQFEPVLSLLKPDWRNPDSE